MGGDCSYSPSILGRSGLVLEVHRIRQGGSPMKTACILSCLVAVALPANASRIESTTNCQAGPNSSGPRPDFCAASYYDPASPSEKWAESYVATRYRYHETTGLSVAASVSSEASSFAYTPLDLGFLRASSTADISMQTAITVDSGVVGPLSAPTSVRIWEFLQGRFPFTLGTPFQHAAALDIRR